MPTEKKTELWVTVAAMTVGAVLSVVSQLYPEDAPEWARAVSIIGGTVLTVFSALGYTIARTAKKIADGKALVEVEKAQAGSIVLDLSGDDEEDDDSPELVDPPEVPDA